MALLPQSLKYELATGEYPDIRTIVHDEVMRTLGNVFPGRQWEPGSRLTAAQHTRLKERAGSFILQAGRQVVIANTVARSVANNEPAFRPPGADPPDTPRSLLAGRVGAALYDFIQRPRPLRLPVHPPVEQRSPLQSALLVTSATATGKTVPIAELARRAGVGHPFSGRDLEPNRVLLVVPDQALLLSYLDPDETLRRWLPDVRVSAYWERSKEVGAPIQLVIDESLPEAIASGAIDLADYPIRVVDEGHHLGSPTMLRQLGGLAAGRLIVCTATPRKVRRYFEVFTGSTARSAAEEGITRPVRLLTYQYGPEAGASEKLAATVAARLLEAGLQVAVYARQVPGKVGTRQAQDIAQLINGSDISLPEQAAVEAGGEYVRVIATTATAQENAESLQAHKKGKIRGYVAVGMLNEGVNVPMDALIIMGRRSQTQVDQISGRIARPGNGPGLLIELLPRIISPGGKPLASIWRTYGFDLEEPIAQGRQIGPLDELLTEEQAGAAARATDQTVDPIEPLANQSTVPEEVLASLLAPDMQEFLAPPVALREVTIAPEDWGRYMPPPEGSKPLSRLAAQYNVPEMWLQRKLDALASRSDVTITYVGVRTTEIATGGRRLGYERWYGPETEAYLDKNPPLPLAEAEAMSTDDLAAMAGVSWDIAKGIINRLELAHVDLLRPSGRQVKYYRLPEIKKFIAEIEKIPAAEPTDVILTDLDEELAPDFAYSFVRQPRNGITAAERWCHPDSGKNGIALHVSAADAARIREAYHNPPLATADDIGITEMARLANASVTKIVQHLRNLPDAERPEMRWLRSRREHRGSNHMKREEGLRIVQSIQARPLAPDRVTMPLLQHYFDSHHLTILKRIRALVEQDVLTASEAEPQPVRLIGIGPDVPTWSWKTMQALEEAGVPLRNPDPEQRIDYARVARGPYDTNWLYSQQIQQRAIAPAKLAKLPSNERIAFINPGHDPPRQSMEIEAFAAALAVSKSAVLQAASEASDVVLYCKNDNPANPRYFVTPSAQIILQRYMAPDKAWIKADRAKQLLGLTDIAIQYCLVGARRRRQGLTRQRPGAGLEVHKDWIIDMQSRLPHLPANTGEWISHADLAVRVNMSPAALVTYLRQHHRVGSQEVRLVPTYSGGALVNYDVAYAPRLWHAVRDQARTEEGLDNV